LITGPPLPRGGWVGLWGYRAINLAPIPLTRIASQSGLSPLGRGEARALGGIAVQFV
jgi:hypothetical protein